MRVILCQLALVAGLAFAFTSPVSAQSDFVRGDCNIDASIDIGDPVFILGVLFSGSAAPSCDDACDSNDDGMIDIGDPIFTLAYLFSGGADPQMPFPACGSDPTADALDCAMFPLCFVPVEDCANGVDDDSDGDIDCLDADCVGDPACVEDCTNGVDDDADGDIDCMDADCVGNAACPEICNNGLDDDGDTFTDCADSDCIGNPICPEICDNGVDDDGDTFVDCQDVDCDNTIECTEICDNGLDEDGDGFIDCDDFDCDNDPACVENCTNGVDDDGDGFIDCIDFDCDNDPACIEDCTNGIDDDGNGFVDCDDFDCIGNPACPELCGNAVDDDGDGLIDCDDPDCIGTAACPEDCTNGVDDDGDGFIDCADFDCAANPACFMGAPPLVINEVDYDQVGSDANEFIEIFNAGIDPIPLAGIALVLVNGSNSLDYNIIDLSVAGASIPAGGYLVVHSSTVTIAAGAQSIVFNSATNNVQNGAPDGIALVNLSADFVYDALSYEGQITAAMITGITNPVNLVEGTAATVADTNGDAGLVLVRSPNGADTDDASVDWSTSLTPTPGAANP